MIIRRRRTADLEGCARILAEVHEHSGYPHHWPDDPERWLTPEGLTDAWVAEEDGRIVGHGALCGRAVNRLFVSPAAGGRGTGARLLRTLEREAARRGLRAVLEVTSSDTAAIALYERLGWVRRVTEYQDWGEEAQVEVHRYEAPEAPDPAAAGDAPTTPSTPARFKDLALDANDHQALADWWCAAIGYVRRDTPGDAAAPVHWPVPIVDPTGGGPLIWINRVEEAKTVKNRMHLDVFGDTARLLELGATLVRRRGGDIEWDILADPEGNEFCVFVPGE